MREIPYNRTDAVNYAKQWALDRNPAFYNFDNLGGDCTNFASQVIFAGSKIMNYTPVMGWYYRSLNDRTASWTGVEYLYQFLINNQSIGPYGHEIAKAEAMPGDIVQFGKLNGRFYHSPVITQVTPEILVAAHSYDALDRPLSTYEYEQIRFIHIDGVRVW